MSTRKRSTLSAMAAVIIASVLLLSYEFWSFADTGDSVTINSSSSVNGKETSATCIMAFTQKSLFRGDRLVTINCGEQPIVLFVETTSGDKLRKVIDLDADGAIAFIIDDSTSVEGEYYESRDQLIAEKNPTGAFTLQLTNG